MSAINNAFGANAHAPYHVTCAYADNFSQIIEIPTPICPLCNLHGPTIKID